jgi:nucleoside-diphosphate-sugar epimerase
MVELVLGGEGLIGSTLVKKLRNQGHEVISLDMKTGCDLRTVDLAPFERADRVWFLAWDTGGAKYIEAADRQHEMYKHNCELSAHVFDALARTGKPFVYATSQLAGLPNAYGLTKLMAEQWTRQLGGKVARLWNTYGWENPDSKSHVVTDLVLSALSRGHIKCLTNGTERRRFIYKSDCASALVQLFDSDMETADISGPNWLSIKEVAEVIAAQLNVEVLFGESKGSEIIVDPVNLLPDWTPATSFSDGISKVIDDAREYLANRATDAGDAHLGEAVLQAG